MFSGTNLASGVYERLFDEKKYLERTKRNLFWFGGKTRQMNLYNLKVGIAGLGGMGSHLAELLVRLGVGHLKIADPDTIELSNLNRQVIASQNTIGRSKAETSADQLRDISQDFELIVYDQGITSENVSEFVSNLDVVIDEIDVYPLRAHVLLHEAARQRNIPIYSTFVIGVGCHIYKFFGQDFTFSDFLNVQESDLDQPSAQLLVDRFCHPLPSYLKSKSRFESFIQEVGLGAPILGTSTLLGQSLLVIRMIDDLIGIKGFEGSPQTPTMPEFIKVDPLDLSLKVCHVKESKHKIYEAQSI